MSAVAKRKPVRQIKPRTTQRRVLARSAVLRASVRHIVQPGHVVAQAPARRRETIAGFLRRTKWSRHSKRYGWQFTIPTICVVNGEPVLQKHWRTTRIRAGDKIEFWSRPMGGHGGTGKQVLGIVALIAVAALAIAAPYAAGAGYLGAWAAENLAVGTFGGALLSGTIGCGGTLRIDALS